MNGPEKESRPPPGVIPCQSCGLPFLASPGEDACPDCRRGTDDYVGTTGRCAVTGRKLTDEELARVRHVLRQFPFGAVRRSMRATWHHWRDEDDENYYPDLPRLRETARRLLEQVIRQGGSSSRGDLPPSGATGY